MVMICAHIVVQTIHHECFQKSFCLSNAEYLGPKTYIIFHLEVGENFCDSFNIPTPLLEKSEKINIYKCVKSIFVDSNFFLYFHTT